MILFSRYLSISHFSKSTLSAKKYLRSISQSALHYRPNNLRAYSKQQNVKDRVVQAFFDTSQTHIKISQAAQRLNDVSSFSTPAHSFYQVSLPFAQNDYLKRKMVQFFNQHIRTGRILQLMDYIAANVSYRYCTPLKDSQVSLNQLEFIAVTAAIDQIDFFSPISAKQDCTFFGYVSYVGKSSMQVQIDVIQKDSINDNKQMLKCTAKFVMAARNKKTLKAYQVPPLNIQNQPQTFKIIHQLGQQRQQNRKNQAKRALQISPPSYQQSSIVHQIMLQTNKNNDRWIPIASTTQHNTLLMHLEDKNLSGKIFGGFILRLAYQLGWLCKFPKITHIDDVQFLGPVEVGTSVDFEAVIGYVCQKYRLIHVVVTCKNQKPTGQQLTTNILRITFEYDNDIEVNKVYPQTLSETMLYIQSLRRVNKYLGN